MYFITGKITENEKDLAYGVYDMEKQRAMIMSKKATRQLVSAGEVVCGFEKFFNGMQGKIYVRKNKDYIWKGVPELNGMGAPEDPKDNELQVLIGCNGFKEVKSYITVNSLGVVRIYNKSEIQDEVAKGIIIGASIGDTGHVVTYINEEVSNDWISSLGYKRNEIGLWTKESK